MFLILKNKIIISVFWSFWLLNTFTAPRFAGQYVLCLEVSAYSSAKNKFPQVLVRHRTHVRLSPWVDYYHRLLQMFHSMHLQRKSSPAFRWPRIRSTRIYEWVRGDSGWPIRELDWFFRLIAAIVQFESWILRSLRLCYWKWRF